MKKKHKKNLKKNINQPTKIIHSPSPAPSDPLQVYLKEIGNFPILSKEEEEKLSKEFYETKDARIAQALAQANLRFVVKIATEYTRFGSRLIDLIQEGNIGLLHAIKEFNPYKGARLITYAVWWIRGYIQEYLMRQYSLVRIGTSAKQKKLFYLLKKQQEQLVQLPYQDTTKLLTHSGFKEKEVQAMQERITARDFSLDQPTGEKSGVNIVDIQEKEEERSLEENFIFLQEKALLQKSIKKLYPRLNKKELFILENRLLAESPLTLQKIGQKFSVTREYIRQVESHLIKKIKAQMAIIKQV